MQTNITCMCGECLKWMDHIGFVTAQGAVCFPGLHCSVSRVLCEGTVPKGPCISCTSQVSAAQVQVLGYSARAQTWLGMRFVPFPGPSSSGDQVLGERTVPGGLCILITSLVPPTQFPGGAARALSQMCFVSPLGS